MKIDRILTGKYTAMPTFLLVMLLTFYLTFTVVGKWLSDLLQLGIDALTGVVDAARTAYGSNPVVHSLIIDGVFAGVGSVLVFLPIIVTLFFFLSLLEDSGYMARVAFVMDKLLRKMAASENINLSIKVKFLGIDFLNFIISVSSILLVFFKYSAMTSSFLKMRLYFWISF